MRKDGSLSELSRFGEPAILVLLALNSGPQHGYALMTTIEQELGFKLGPGTLYGAIAKLLKLGMIRRVAGVDRAKPYEITDSGRAAVAEFVRAWTPVLKLGQGVVS